MTNRFTFRNAPAITHRSNKCFPSNPSWDRLRGARDVFVWWNDSACSFSMSSQSWLNDKRMRIHSDICPRSQNGWRQWFLWYPTPEASTSCVDIVRRRNVCSDTLSQVDSLFMIWNNRELSKFHSDKQQTHMSSRFLWSERYSEPTWGFRCLREPLALASDSKSTLRTLYCRCRKRSDFLAGSQSSCTLSLNYSTQSCRASRDPGTSPAHERAALCRGWHRRRIPGAVGLAVFRIILFPDRCCTSFANLKFEVNLLGLAASPTTTVVW